MPPISTGFARLREFREALRGREAGLREQEEFARKPREEKMLLALRKREKFEGKEITAKAAAAACFEWADARRDVAPEATERTLALLPVVLGECWRRSFDRKERRDVSSVLVKALEDDVLRIRRAAIASLRALYAQPRGDAYDPAAPEKIRDAAAKAWKRHVAQANR
jgi:hypothetical protein